VHDQALTAAYLNGLQDYGWDGEVDSVKFTRATAAALNAATWLGHGSELAPSRDGGTIWARQCCVANQGGDKAGNQHSNRGGALGRRLQLVLDLADEARQLQPHLHL
jgi:hypothetical protein